MRVRPAQIRASSVAVFIYLLGVAGVAAGITLLFLGMRAIMDVGGMCAEGGPYVIETPCPGGSAQATVLGFFLGLGSFLLAASSVPRVGDWAYAVLGLGWPALFGALGLNFLQGGFGPPGERPGWAWGWLVCGVLFEAMALVPVAFGIRAFWYALRHGVPADGAPLVRAAEAAGGGASAVPARPGDGTGLVDDLERLVALHAIGALGDDEFTLAKEALIQQSAPAPTTPGRAGPRSRP